MRLTDATVKSLPAPQSGAKIYVCDQLEGFGVRVSQGGTKSFVLTYGKHRERVTIGRYPIIGLADARNRARTLLAERTLGHYRPARLLASEALLRFLGEQREKNRPITVTYTHRLLLNHFPKLWRMSLEEIRTEDIMQVTDALLKKGQGGAANHAFTAIRTFLKWSTRRRYIHHSPIEAIELPSKNKSRERVLNDEELRAVWRAADETGYPFGDIIKLLILTGARRTEIGSLRAEWVDFDKQLICLPKEICKNRRSHTFPLGALSSTLIMRGSSTATGLLFPNQQKTLPFNSWSKAKAQLDKKIQSKLECKIQCKPWTLHDLRRTYCTNLQRLGVRLEVIESLVNHVSGTRSGVAGVYQRHRWEAEMREAVATYEKRFIQHIAH
jgi:integrase